MFLLWSIKNTWKSNLFKIYNFIFLDLDDTLYSYDECHKSGLDAFTQYCRVNFKIKDSYSLEKYNLARKIVNNRLHGQAASHSRLLYAKEFCEMLEIDPVLYAIKLEDEYWNSFLKTMKLRPGVLEFFTLLKKLGKKVALVTDLTTNIQLKKLEILNIGHYFDVIVTSEEAGKEKPEKEIFELAFHKLKAVKDQSLMIGDNYKKDILGAENFGMDAYLLGSSEQDVKILASFEDAIRLIHEPRL